MKPVWISPAPAEGVQPLAEEAIQAAGKTVSDEAYTGLSYHIEGLTLSDVWEDGLTPFSRR